MGTKPKRRISDLIDSLHQDRRPLVVRFGAVKYAKYKADLAEVVKAAKDGRPMPSTEELANYFREAYGVVVAPSTIRENLRGLRKG